jgi:hypothetical protein
MTIKKRGRPATGRSNHHRILSFEISAAYTRLRADGVEHAKALETLASQEWGRYPDLHLKSYSVAKIKAAIDESRQVGVSDDDFKHSKRLQKVNATYKDVFEIDPKTGEVVPKRI